MIAVFEFIAKIVRIVKTLIYVYITMLLLTAIFGYAHLTQTVMSLVSIGIIWGVWFLIVDFAFSPRQEANGDKLPSRVRASNASNFTRVITVVFLSICLLALIGFSLGFVL